MIDLTVYIVLFTFILCLLYSLNEEFKKKDSLKNSILLSIANIDNLIGTLMYFCDQNKKTNEEINKKLIKSILSIRNDFIINIKPEAESYWPNSKYSINEISNLLEILINHSKYDEWYRGIISLQIDKEKWSNRFSNQTESLMRVCGFKKNIFKRYKYQINHNGGK